MDIKILQTNLKEYDLRKKLETISKDITASKKLSNGERIPLSITELCQAIKKERFPYKYKLVIRRGFYRSLYFRYDITIKDREISIESKFSLERLLNLLIALFLVPFGILCTIAPFPVMLKGDMPWIIGIFIILLGVFLIWFCKEMWNLYTKEPKRIMDKFIDVFLKEYIF